MVRCQTKRVLAKRTTIAVGDSIQERLTLAKRLKPRNFHEDPDRPLREEEWIAMFRQSDT